MIWKINLVASVKDDILRHIKSCIKPSLFCMANKEVKISNLRKKKDKILNSRRLSHCFVPNDQYMGTKFKMTLYGEQR